MYANVGCIRDFLKQDLALEFYRNQNKHISILTDIYINHDQIHHIRNNWLASFIFSPWDNHTEELPVLLHPDLKGVTEVDTDPKRRFAFFKFTRKLRARGHFFEELKSYMENANKENKNKIILGDFDSIMDKTTVMVEIKLKESIHFVSTLSCQNSSSWIMAQGSMKNGKPRFLWVHPLR